MPVGQLQALLLGHPPPSSTIPSNVDPRLERLVSLGEVYYRLRQFAAGHGGRQGAQPDGEDTTLLHSGTGQYMRAFCRELGGLLHEYARQVLALMGPHPHLRALPAQLEAQLSTVVPSLDSCHYRFIYLFMIAAHEHHAGSGPSHRARYDLWRSFPS